MARNKWTEAEVNMLKFLFGKIGPKCYSMFKCHPRRSVQLKANELGLLGRGAAALRGTDKRTPYDIASRISVARIIKANQARRGVVNVINEAELFCNEFDKVTERIESSRLKREEKQCQGN